jgi:CheY-like chemotaxis protein
VELDRPGVEAPASVSPEDKAGSHSAGPLKLLLTEDNPVNIIVAERLLEKRGHTVVIAHNGREAIKALSRERFDAVLMDIEMPVMDGYDTTESIRRPGSLVLDSNIPIIAMTAHAMDEHQRQCIEAGMDEFVSKPLALDDMIGKIRKAIEKRHAINQGAGM